MIFYTWLIASIVSLMLEMGHPGLFLHLSFAVGSGVAAIASVYIPELAYQILIFLGSSIISIGILHVWMRKKFSSLEPHERTNTHALVGSQATVTQEIASHGVGAVKIGGETWSARSLHDTAISSGVRVEVIEVKGAHVVVRPTS